MSDLSCRLKALGDPTRQRILALLPDTDACADVMNVGELAEALDQPQPTVSHHLKVLLQADLVQNRKMCRDVYYWIDRATFDRTLAETAALSRRPG
jgi:ArsR family transcriptional regulator, arsenate/arsenite/antimonite-responsive transcriptional repressor